MQLWSLSKRKKGFKKGTDGKRINLMKQFFVRFVVQTADNALTEKLKSLNLLSIEEATMESFESKELAKAINNLKLQLNMQ